MSVGSHDNKKLHIYVYVCIRLKNRTEMHKKTYNQNQRTNSFGRVTKLQITLDILISFLKIMFMILKFL